MRVRLWLLHFIPQDTFCHPTIPVRGHHVCQLDLFFLKATQVLPAQLKTGPDHLLTSPRIPSFPAPSSLILVLPANFQQARCKGRRVRLMAEPVPRVGVGVLVVRGSTVLVGRRRSSNGHGTFALPGGHLDFGETWEECAAREVKEETGLSIHNITFVFVTNTVTRDEKRPTHYVTIFMRGEQNNATEEPENLEPDKCDGWEWVEWPNVPHPIFLPLQSLIASNYKL